MERTAQAIRVFNDVYCTLYNGLKLLIKQPIYRNVLKKNKIYENKYVGKRCFILGNGPSLKDLDFKVLAEEYVFTVNLLSKNPDYKKLKSNFHVFTDPVFFDLNNEENYSEEYLDAFKNINSNTNKPVCFMPVQALPFVRKCMLDKILHINYINTCLSFHDSMKGTQKFERLTVSHSTVVLNAIQLAIYMGFSEIYLLGCDCTGIVTTIDLILNNEIKTYAYIVDEKEKHRMNNDGMGNEMEKSCLGWMRIFHEYKWIANICKKAGIKLVNCSSMTVLDSITQMDIGEVLKLYQRK